VQHGSEGFPERRTPSSLGAPWTESALKARGPLRTSGSTHIACGSNTVRVAAPEALAAEIREQSLDVRAGVEGPLQQVLVQSSTGDLVRVDDKPRISLGGEPGPRVESFPELRIVDVVKRSAH
jgi:hypothetical protein